MKAHAIVDDTPGGNGLEVLRRLFQRFDPASAQANFKIMSKSMRPLRSKVGHNLFSH